MRLSAPTPARLTRNMALSWGLGRKVQLGTVFRFPRDLSPFRYKDAFRISASVLFCLTLEKMLWYRDLLSFHINLLILRLWQ